MLDYYCHHYLSCVFCIPSITTRNSTAIPFKVKGHCHFSLIDHLLKRSDFIFIFINSTTVNLSEKTFNVMLIIDIAAYERNFLWTQCWRFYSWILHLTKFIVECLSHQLYFTLETKFLIFFPG